jgi:hypothetical protein
MHIKPCIINNDEDVCELAYLKRKVTKNPMKSFNKQGSFSTSSLCNKKTKEKGTMKREKLKNRKGK